MTPQQQPELAVGASVSDNNPAVGATFTLSATVQNDGDGASAATTLRFFRSLDATITISDTEVGTDTVAELAASGTSRVSVDVTAPAAAGTYYYGACVDAVADESDTSNNCSASVQVSVREPDEPDEPDLVVAAPTVSNSTPAVGATFTLSVRVEGAEDGPATMTLSIYRSTDATITRSDTLVGTVVAELATSGNSRQVAQLAASTTPAPYYVGEVELTAPNTPGIYYYGACLDAVDTSTDCSASQQVNVRGDQPQQQPDLTVGASVSDNDLELAESFTLSATVSNGGDGASAATTLHYYHSTDATITTSDTAVGTASVGALSPSGTSAHSISLRAPSTTGAHYYGACVDAVAGESDTANNCSASVRVDASEPPPPLQGGPDLVVLAPGVGQNNREPGETFAILVTVHNQGDSESAATTLHYYRSTDATITTSDTSEGTDAVSALGPSRSSGESTSLTVPSTAGTYYYGACVDPVTEETDTTNNCSSSVQVDVN